MKLTREFFARPSPIVAPELIGRRLVRNFKDKKYSVLITETGAYEGGKRQGLCYGPGEIYVAIFRGGYEMLCIGTEAIGIPSVVTIRKAYPLEGVDADLTGSGRLSRALHIDKKFECAGIGCTDLYIEGDPAGTSRVLVITPDMEKMAENCLGYYRLF